MPSDREALALTRRYQRQLAALAARAEAALANVWDGLGSWDDADVDRFAAAAAPVVGGAKSAGAALTAGYLGLLLTTPFGFTPPSIDGVDFRDPFLGYWRALNQGKDWTEAVTTGRTRAGTLGFDSAQSAARDTATEIDQAEDRIVGWERVLTGVSCEFCATVATQRYRSAETASFGHQRCDCTVVPIVGRQSPGRVINRDLLANVKSLGADSTGYVSPDGSPAARPADAPVEAP